MPRICILIALLTYCLPSLATDVSLLTGYQFNSDFEIVSANQLPPQVEPATGEPGTMWNWMTAPPSASR